MCPGELYSFVCKQICRYEPDLTEPLPNEKYEGQNNNLMQDGYAN
jgi:hypothetical protein